MGVHAAPIFSRTAHACFMSCEGPQSITMHTGITAPHSTPSITFTNRARLRPARDTKCADALVTSSPVPSIAASCELCFAIARPMIAQHAVEQRHDLRPIRERPAAS